MAHLQTMMKSCAAIAVLALGIASAGTVRAAVTESTDAVRSVAVEARPSAEINEPIRVIRPPISTTLQQENWRKTILQTARPKKGCFAATYPETQWREVQCKAAPNRPYPPKAGVRPEIVGGGTDFSAQVTGHVSKGEGSFDSVSGVTSESGGSNPNAYSLQLNTQFFTTSTCSTSPDPSSCQGWEQFVYSSSGVGFIQYWLIQYGPSGTTCPSGWNTFTFSSTGPVYCWRNANNSAPAPSETIASLGQLKVGGAVAGVNGPDDSIAISVGNSVYTASGDNYFPDLGSQWQKAEFNVFGDGGGDQANFNTGSTIVVRTGVDNGTAAAPTCDGEGFTGETNNLTLTGTPSVVAGTPLPSVVFTESNAANLTPASCATASSNGDTHITTFGNLYYDFQASGDFVLAQDGSAFQVQARQASGAPTWPNASVNKAIAAQFGSTRVALYIEPTRLIVGGTDRDLADGATLQAGGGVQIVRHGDLYVVSDDHGNSVSATLNSTWINVTIGMGHSPAQTRGLLVSANSQALLAANGAVLNEPVAFDTLYSSYADSWRVQPNQSLFTVESVIRSGIPLKPFYVQDLAPAVSAQAQAACKAAGVSSPTLLESCTLDNAVLQDRASVRLYTRILPPLHVIKPVLLNRAIEKTVE